jgi:hypothetical protein
MELLNILKRFTKFSIRPIGYFGELTIGCILGGIDANYCEIFMKSDFISKVYMQHLKPEIRI